MSQKFAITGFILVALAATGAGYLVIYEKKPEPVSEAVECDSCAARKQNLKKVREALRPAESRTE